MSEIRQVIGVLKRELKARGLTYRELARRLKLSEASVKRLFSTGRFTLQRLEAVAGVLELTLAELMQQAAGAAPRIASLTRAQEAELVADPKLLLVAVCAINNWTPADIVRAYAMTTAECLQRLARLDRLRIIDLLPGDRVRINVSRDFDWLPDGPLRHFFRQQALEDFLAGPFAARAEMFAFTHGMLTPAANAQFQVQLRRLRQSFAELHAESLRAPLDQRVGTGLMLALREWEPKGFAALRRRP